MEITPGGSIGHYRIEGLLGEGGMGRVYAGFDETLRRRVALKSIRFSHRLRPEAKARLLREARILSQLAHPGVCKIHDYIEGADGDILVLEFVAGRKLGEALKEGLSYRRKLRIAEEIAGVLAAVHGQGIAHRDLKPDNIMLDGEGRVKVLDFGLSRVAADDLLPGPPLSTGGPPAPPAGEGWGTETAAEEGPERTAALSAAPSLSTTDPLTRAGVVIGTPGYMSPEQARGEPAAEVSDLYSFGLVLQELFTGQPPFDRSLDKATRLEMARAGITPKAVGLDADLAALIERLKSPIPAARPSAVDVVERLAWIRTRPARRRARTLTLGAVVVLALFGAAMALLAFRAVRAERRAREEAAAAEQVGRFLVGLFEVADPAESRGSPVTVRTILDRGAGRIETELAGQPLAQARMMNAMGSVYLNLGVFDQAERFLTRARELRQLHLPSGHADLGRTLNDLSQLYYVQGRYAEAAPLALRALAIREAALGPRHPDVAESLSNLATLRRVQGRYEEAERLHRRSLAIGEETLGPDHPDVAQFLNNFAFLYWQQGRCGEAAPLFERALAIREKALPPDHLDLAESLNNVAAVRLDQGRPQEAEALHRRALAILEKALGPDHPDVANLLVNLAAFQREQNRPADAEPLLQRALAIQERALGPDHPRLVHALHQLALLRRAQGRTEEAEALFLRVQAIHERTPEADPQAAGQAREAYAALLRQTGRAMEAEALEARTGAHRGRR